MLLFKLTKEMKCEDKGVSKRLSGIVDILVSFLFSFHHYLLCDVLALTMI